MFVFSYHCVAILEPEFFYKKVFVKISQNSQKTPVPQTLF